MFDLIFIFSLLGCLQAAAGERPLPFHSPLDWDTTGILALLYIFDFFRCMWTHEHYGTNPTRDNSVDIILTFFAFVYHVGLIIIIEFVTSTVCWYKNYYTWVCYNPFSIIYRKRLVHSVYIVKSTLKLSHPVICLECTLIVIISSAGLPNVQQLQANKYRWSVPSLLLQLSISVCLVVNNDS